MAAIAPKFYLSALNIFMNPILTPNVAASGNIAVTANGTLITPKTPVRHLNDVPTKDADLVAVAGAVAGKWQAEEWFAIKYTLQADFAGEATLYTNLVKARSAAGGGTHGLATDLNMLDDEADDALPYVKNYVFNKYGAKHATDYYGDFGMEHRHGGYELPHDRHQRQIAIQTMIDGLQKNNWITETYGVNWWMTFQAKYNAALLAAEDNSGNISDYVGNLNKLRTSIRRTLHSVLLILEGNFPDTFEQVKREWGFLKNRY